MKQPKFKVGQVVGVRGSQYLFFKVDHREQRLLSYRNKMPTTVIEYHLHGWTHPELETNLRKLTKKEIANGK